MCVCGETYGGGICRKNRHLRGEVVKFLVRERLGKRLLHEQRQIGRRFYSRHGSVRSEAKPSKQDDQYAVSNGETDRLRTGSLLVQY